MTERHNESPHDRLSLAQEQPNATVWRVVAWIVIGLGLLTAIAGIIFVPGRTWPALLLSNIYLLSVTLAGTLFISIHFVANAGWSVVLRRVAEAMMASLPVVAILMLLLFFGRHELYPWSHEAELASGGVAHGGAAHMSPSKAFYLSTPFFFGRMALMLGVWVALAWAMRQVSLQQDDDPAPIHHQRLVRYSAAFIVVFAISFSLASIDWLMSLAPHWYSTMFAVYVFAGLFLSGLAALTLIVVLLRQAGPLAGIVNETHLHDLGKLLFAFSTFWAYIWLSQYLLIWYSNLPEEVPHYLRRTGGAWLPLFLLNVVVNWVVPFVLLLRRQAKRSPRLLAGVSVLLLVGHWLDLYLLISPESAAAPSVGPLEVLIPASYVGVFFLLTWRALGRAPVVPLHDPYLDESLTHHS